MPISVSGKSIEPAALPGPARSSIASASELPAVAGHPSGRLLALIALCGLTSVCLGAIIAGVPWLWAGAAWFGGILVTACMLSSEVGVATLVLVFTLFQRDQVFAASLPLFGGGVKPTDLLLFATLGGWVARSLARGQPSHHLSRTVLLFSLAYVGWAVLSAFLAISRGAFYKDSLLELRPLLQYTLILPLLTEFTVVRVFRVCCLFLLAAVFVAAKAVYKYATGQGSQALYGSGSIRVMSVSFSVLLIASVLGLALFAGSERRRLPWLFASLAALLGLGVTLQRAAFIALPFGLLTMAVMLQGTQRRRLAVGLTLTGLLAAAAALSTGAGTQGKPSLLSAVVTRAASITDFGEDVSAQHRLREWNAALEIVRRHPIVGGGLGTRVGFYSPMYEKGPQMGYWSSDIYMHNSYMWMLTKMGLVGLGCFLALLAAIGREVLVHRRHPCAVRRSLLAGLVATLVLFVICSFFGPLFNVDDSSGLVAFTIGGICVLLRSTPLSWTAKSI